MPGGGGGGREGGRKGGRVGGRKGGREEGRKGGRALSHVELGQDNCGHSCTDSIGCDNNLC